MIMGIDQSLTETGFCIIEKGKIIEQGIIKPKTSGVKRLQEIRNKLLTIIDKYKPTIIALEDYAYGTRNSRATFSMGELGGVLKLAFLDKNQNYCIIQPALLKKYVCGKGNAKKEQMLLQAYKKFGIEFQNNNLCDAYCLASFVEHQSKVD